MLDVSRLKLAFAMIVKDHNENILYLATKLVDCYLSFLVKLKALEWATNYVKSYS